MKSTDTQGKTIPLRCIYLSLLFILYHSINSHCMAQQAGDVPSDSYGMVKTNMKISYDYTNAPVSDHFNARVSYELLKNKKFSLSANANYNSLYSDFSSDALPDGYDPQLMGMNKTHIYGQAGLSTTFRNKLFGCPFMAFATMSIDWGDRRFQRISGIAMGLFMLRANRSTQFGIGPLILINSTSKVPAFLVFIYRHRFNDNLAINLYGGMFGMDYTPTKYDLITIGGDVDVRSFYFRPNHPGLPERCRYTNTNFRPGIKYKRRIATNLYGEVQGGVILKMSSRVTGITGTKIYFDLPMPTRPFLQFSLNYAL